VAPLSVLLVASFPTLEVEQGIAFPVVGPTAAIAKDGSGSRGDGDSGGGGSGGGGDSDGRGSGGGGGDSDDGDGGGSGSGRDDDRGRDGDRRDEDDSGRRKSEDYGPHGERIETAGDRMEIFYPDGYSETLERGRFRLRDPRGRTVIERRATPEDFSRVKSLMH
jgi:hypothetical protein